MTIDTAANNIMPHSTGSLLCVEVKTMVTHEAYFDMYVPASEKILKEFGEIRLLFFYPDPDNFPGWDEKAANQDLLYQRDSGHLIKKVALVNAPPMVTMRWQLLHPLLGGEIKNFTSDQLQEALLWAKGNL